MKRKDKSTLNSHPLATVVSLGCAKNLVDSETLTAQLVNLGYRLSADPSRSAVIVVNTCGFLESAVSEAVETILDLSRHKRSGSCRLLVATGCMVQRYGKKLPDLLPEVDFFLGTSHYHDLEKILGTHDSGDLGPLFISRPKQFIEPAAARLRSTPFYSAYLKIADGCDNRCSFCMIPGLRGPYRSRSAKAILEEAALLGREGVVEINLIAQDITAFGADRGETHALPRLLGALEQIEGVQWIRLLYAYPGRISESLLDTMARSEKIVPYLDIPLQHCAPDILREMHREESIPDVERIVDSIRTVVPDIALRTSLMVGFPGETEANFRKLVDFVERSRFEHLGVFAFSPEAGSRAARLPGRIEESVKEERRNTLLAVQKSISRTLLARLVGKTIPVLVEGPHPETELLLAARLPSQAPEVDGTVIITSGNGESGAIVSCRITAAHDYDVEGELLEAGEMRESAPRAGEDSAGP
jgi:ribosomal protein S12 methylthiotransferase